MVFSATLQETAPSLSAVVENIDVLQVLSPLPDVSKKRLTASKRRTQKSDLTSSPYKKELVEKIKDSKAVAKVKKNMQVKVKKVASQPENKRDGMHYLWRNF